jgi:dihydroorotate dehydrogenase (fumarate)
MDLSTEYMGLKLKKISNFRKLEDLGASAIVNYSLFEEEITYDVYELHHHTTFGTDSYAESLSYFPDPEHFTLGPEEYLEHIQRAKEAVAIPVIGSLNGFSPGGWTKYARLIEQAGADALELNLYFIPTDPASDSVKIEASYIEILNMVKSTVKIPVAVKLSPFFSAMANMAKKLDAAGADALVLFNRFYQPDIDLDMLDVVPNLVLSSPFSARVPLRWIAILHGQVEASLAATSGVHEAEDALKMLMAGADVTMVCSTLLKKGMEHTGQILRDMEEWMEENEYDSVAQMKGSMSQKSAGDPAAFERANYMKALRSYRIT